MSEARVWAPPFVYGPWQILWTRFGVVGPDSDKNRTTLSISYQSVSQAPSPFEIEIDDGERRHRRQGPGTHRVVLLGNSAVQIRVRCKSHSIGQSVVVRA